MKIIRTYKFRLRPTAAQAARMSSWCAAVRHVYNAALQQREWYGRAVGTDPHGRDSRFNSFRQGRELKDIRAAFKWIEDAPADILMAAVRDLDKAFDAFFASRARYPTPRRADQNNSFALPVFVQGKARPKGYFVNVVFGQDSVRLPKFGRVRWVRHRKIRGRPKTANVVREGDRWFICISSEIEIADRSPAAAAVGIDFGVAIPLATSDGETLSLARTAPRIAQREKRLRRELARCKRGSRRRSARKRRLSEHTRRTAARRKGRLHAITTDLARKYGLIVIEDLRVANMTASAKGTVDEPGSNVRAKAGLNRSLLDLSLHAFRALLTYKVAARGGTLIAVNPRNTSRTCAACAHVDKDSRRSQAIFVCVACGHEANADINAAKIILARGISQSSATVLGRRKAPSEPRQRPATPKSCGSPAMGRDQHSKFRGESAVSAAESAGCSSSGCGPRRCRW